MQSLILVLPSVDSLVVTLLDHYDAHDIVDEPILQQNKVQCLAKEFGVSPPEASKQLDDLEKDLLDNGHVDLGVNSYDVDCTIWLTEHKTLLVVTSTAHVRDRARAVLAGQLREVSQLKSFSNHYSHFRYRPPGSLAADELTTNLQRKGWTIEAPIG
jgi:hypothetical protein